MLWVEDIEDIAAESSWQRCLFGESPSKNKELLAVDSCTVVGEHWHPPFRSHEEPLPGDCVQNIDLAVVFVLSYAPKDIDTLGVWVIGSCVTMQAQWHGIL